jgi:hypothetical protein
LIFTVLVTVSLLLGRIPEVDPYRPWARPPEPVRHRWRG